MYKFHVTTYGTAECSAAVSRIDEWADTVWHIDRHIGRPPIEGYNRFDVLPDYDFADFEN